MEVYKILHKPTGYFIQPSNDGNHWSNVGKKGKVYEGNNMWSKIQNSSEYRFILVHQGYGIYEELANRFPEHVDKSICHNNIPMVRFATVPEDFEKVFNW